MKNNFLLPNRFKKIGWIIFVPVVLIFLFLEISKIEISFLNIRVFALFSNMFPDGHKFCTIIKDNFTDEILGILMIVSSIFIAFSKEKYEDEFISKIRLESLVWATYLNYGILVLAMLFVYGFAFFYVMEFNMFTVLIFFIIRFNWVVYKSKKLLENEK